MARDGDRWVFGYGSLVWRPDFPFLERRAGYLEGWARRFWQGSTDHRGVPGAPGRVVTLVEEEGGICWGRAYRVEAAVYAEVEGGLDHRERGGFERVEAPVRLRDAAAEAVPAVLYVAREGNPNYLGPAPLAEIAAQVRRSRGPSGPNAEYVLRLAEALRADGVADLHVSALAALVSEPTA